MDVLQDWGEEEEVKKTDRNKILGNPKSIIFCPWNQESFAGMFIL